ncbi:dTDP-4-dehydrorhamnose 3,5-epimerase [Aureibacter tunicatorum]|uniref:dTDP-4-dehydrorhamnose 3,5-epimerase n=1 Tax=Aureibacter tunicatorum TaxID=866807 RepID=A0AAE3XLA9_9BACT|nr:dTDP-4-dehydrorhamnose 3,5-epimerase [Aureibacter tunicatorum]MDR6237049.1 dTDP-4-dehydrorhamnose 3,5-epimerase [Aureibacter tunicatorum]BDD06041.1 dTDP-4-dehydrorhamnose 3,5-epimerase [Aureibacter tunicatorum]
MNIIETDIEGLVEIYPSIFKDDRGYFFESYQQEKLNEGGIPPNFVQDNQSFSLKGTVRGLHLQKEPWAQGKLVRVVKGKVLDVVVDLRPLSSTFGQSRSFVLDDSKNNMLYVPEGFAHGFSALEDSIFHYKCTNYYNKASESGIIWNDSTLNIDWKVDNPIVSDKDMQLLSFAEFKATLF